MCVQRVVRGVVGVLAITTLSTTLRGQITVGRNVQVSLQRSRDAHYEVLLALDPVHVGQMLACSIYYDAPANLVSTVVYHSTDGGRSWTSTLTAADSLGKFGFSSDPTCVYDSDGTAYFGAIAGIGWFNGLHFVMYRSGDGGVTWSHPIQMGNIDREYLTVDHTAGPYRGRIYLNGTGGIPLVDGGERRYTFDLYRSLDGGRAFSGPVSREMQEPGYVGGMGDCGVLTGGALVCVFIQAKGMAGDRAGLPSAIDPAFVPREPTGWVRVVRSDDGGASLRPAITVTNSYDNPYRPSATIPRLAVDTTHGPFRDRLYVVWPDLRRGHREVLLSYSADSAKTWSKPMRINNEPLRGDAPDGDRQLRKDDHDPVVTANKDGIVGVLWYDRHETSDFGWYARFAASLDGGATWLPSVRVAEQPESHPLSETVPMATNVCGGAGLACTTGGAQPVPGGGVNLLVRLNQKPYADAAETTGLVADASGVFHALWVDNRTGIEQVWTAAVTVAGRVTTDSMLAGLADISDHVTFDVANTAYDRRTGAATVDVRLRNASRETIRGPFRMVVTSLTSALGVPDIVAADNGRSRGGAVWELRPLRSGNALSPGESSAPRHLQFVIPHAMPLFGDDELHTRVVDFDVRIYGRVQ